MLICVAALVLLFGTGRRARKPAARDARPRGFRNRPGVVHLAQQQRGGGRRAGVSDRGSRGTPERGISIGVAGASALLAWRLAAHTGSGHNTLHAEAQQLLAAGRDVIVLLGSFAAMAGVISLARVPAHRPGDAKDA